jgi:hypothetical protein
VHLKCVSLTYFLRYKTALKERELKDRDVDKDKNKDKDKEFRDPFGGIGDDDDASCSSVYSHFSANTRNTASTSASHFPLKSHARSRADERRTLSTTRFLPLIVDEEHADRALPLLQEELLRLDR